MKKKKKKPQLRTNVRLVACSSFIGKMDWERREREREGRRERRRSLNGLFKVQESTGI